MKDGNINELLSLIEATVQENFILNVWVPSLIGTSLDYLKFKPLNISQQKLLISPSLQEDLQNIIFNKAFYEIILQNYIPCEGYDIANLTVIDKIFVGLSLRKNTSASFKVKDTEICLTEISEKMKEDLLNNTEPFQPITFTYQDNISIQWRVPTIHLENEADLVSPVFSTKEAEAQLAAVILNTVSSELAKYCDSLTINGAEYILNNFSFLERKDIIDKIPAGALEQVLKRVLLTKEYIEQLLTIKIDEETSETLYINGAFFATL